MDLLLYKEIHPPRAAVHFQTVVIQHLIFRNQRIFDEVSRINFENTAQSNVFHLSFQKNIKKIMAGPNNQKKMQLAYPLTAFKKKLK
ncbi:hypothetical protein [Parapedobacter sp.]